MVYFSRVSCAFALTAPIVLNSVALYLDRWFLIADESMLKMRGLRETCDRDECKDIDYSFTIEMGDCKREGSQLEKFDSAIHGLLIMVTVLCVVAAVLFVTAGLHGNRKLHLGGVVLSAIAFLAQGISGTLLYYLITEWLYCGKSYCDYSRSDNCDVSIGTSYALWGTAFASLLPVVMAAALLSRTSTSATPAPTESEPPTDPPQQHANDVEPKAMEDFEMAPAASAPEGYEHDADSGYYYSAETGLYYDAASGHYLDANTNMWLNPATDEWYEG